MTSTQIHKARKEAGSCTRCGKRPPEKGLLCLPCHKDAKLAQQRCHAALKAEVFTAYGGNRCACCGKAKDIRFLHIDHVNGGGREHRRSLSTQGSDGVYRDLKKRGFPEGFQVLCADCNLAKGFYGECPCQRWDERRLDQAAGVSEALLY